MEGYLQGDSLAAGQGNTLEHSCLEASQEALDHQGKQLKWTLASSPALGPMASSACSQAGRCSELRASGAKKGLASPSDLAAGYVQISHHFVQGT